MKKRKVRGTWVERFRKREKCTGRKRDKVREEEEEGNV